MRQIILIAHNIRSTHNVGSLFRTAEGLGIKKLILSGYTPYPTQAADDRLPHLSSKLTKQIDKTALGAAATLPWEKTEDISQTLKDLKQQGFKIYALEQTAKSVDLPDCQPPEKTAIIVGAEVEGLPTTITDACDECLQIPMFGSKESYNVAVAAGMAMYHLRFPRQITTS